MEGVFPTENIQSTRMSFSLTSIIRLSYIIVPKPFPGPINLKRVWIDVIIVPAVLIGIDFAQGWFWTVIYFCEENGSFPIAYITNYPTQLYMISDYRILIINILILTHHQVQAYLLHVPLIVLIHESFTYYLIVALHSRV